MSQVEEYFWQGFSLSLIVLEGWIGTGGLSKEGLELGHGGSRQVAGGQEAQEDTGILEGQGIETIEGTRVSCSVKSDNVSQVYTKHN